MLTQRPRTRDVIARALPGGVLALVLAASTASAGGVGHYDGGLINVRDYFIPAPGVHALLYNHFYSTDQFNDAQGVEVDVVTVHPPHPSPGIPLSLDVNMRAYVAAPTMIAVKALGRDGLAFAASITPTVTNKALDAALSNAIDVSGSIQAEGLGIGDLFVRPAWLGMTTSRWELGGSYGFYAPIGDYETRHVLVPPDDTIKTVAPSNLGHGYWTNQVQGVLGFYPTREHATVLMTAVTYEVNGKQEGFDRTPGANLTWNWGASHLLAVREDHPLQFELGVAGYNTWQVSDDRGADARSGRTEVRTAGWQLGMTHLRSTINVTLHAFYEYSAKLRFQGDAYTVSIGAKL